jgi:hypothetical protein
MFKPGSALARSGQARRKGGKNCAKTLDALFDGVYIGLPEEFGAVFS